MLSILSGCTATGTAVSLMEEDRVLDSIEHFEKGMEEGDRFAALMLAWIYIQDTHVPADYTKAQAYLDDFQDMGLYAYDQTLNFYPPYVQALLYLEDEDAENDAMAIKLLSRSSYRRYSPALIKLAKSFAFGRGVEANYRLAHQLAREAVYYDDDNKHQYLKYVWLWATHPDDGFRSAMNDSLVLPHEDSMNSRYDFSFYATVAAYHARLGDYDQAVENQREAIERIEKKRSVYPHYQTWLDDYKEYLASYEAELPWSQPEG